MNKAVPVEVVKREQCTTIEFDIAYYRWDDPKDIIAAIVREWSSFTARRWKTVEKATKPTTRDENGSYVNNVRVTVEVIH